MYASRNVEKETVKNLDFIQTFPPHIRYILTVPEKRGKRASGLKRISNGHTVHNQSKITCFYFQKRVACKQIYSALVSILICTKFTKTQLRNEIKP